MVDNTTKLVIGLTGGIGSGKTTASDYFASLGIDVVDADVIAHKLTAKNSPTLRVLQSHFGNWVIDDEGNYNRTAMRQFVFDNAGALQALGDIMHPAIFKSCLHAINQATSVYVILSAPLLIENKNNSPSLFDLCDQILVIDVPKSLQIDRASIRDNSQDIIKIIQKQASRQERQKYAHHIIDNSGTPQEMYAHLQQLHQNYLIHSHDQTQL